MSAPGPVTHRDVSRPEWFEAFLADRGTRKPSVHTLKAYRQDFERDCCDHRWRRRSQVNVFE
jgi:hypothetical protein